MEKIKKTNSSNKNASIYLRYSNKKRDNDDHHMHDDDEEHNEFYYVNHEGLMMMAWPPRSYTCSFCKREFRSAQALGGHMNVHRRDRAQLKQLSHHQISPNINSSPTNNNYDYSTTTTTTTNYNRTHDVINLNLPPNNNNNNNNNNPSNMIFSPQPQSLLSSSPKPASFAIKKIVQPSTSSVDYRSRGVAVKRQFERQDNYVAASTTNNCPSTHAGTSTARFDGNLRKATGVIRVEMEMNFDVGVVDEGLDLELRLGYN